MNRVETQPAGAVRAMLELPVQVIAGKGGVGRSVIASALALRSAERGARTLLLECNAPDNCARHLGVLPAPDEPREVLNNLFLCRMTPHGAMREYALMVLKFKALYNFVFENPVVKYFLRSVPSLGEFTQMGKAWFHSTEKLESGAPKYDRIIIDAPATGHAITLLAVSRVVADTVPKGVMKNAAEEMAGLLEDHARACLHIVATPEEMPVNEAIELAASAGPKLRMRVGLAIMNRVLPPLPLKREALAGLAEDPALAPYVDAVERRLEWEGWQAECVARFERAAIAPVVRLPELEGAVDRRWLLELATSFDRAEAR